MGFRDDMSFQYLLDLQQKLRCVYYDRLNLFHLGKLRNEVDGRIEQTMRREEKPPVNPVGCGGDS